MKSELIKKEAKEVKGFVESNKALPKYCTINNNQYSPYTTAYLFAKVINTPKASDIKVVNIKAPNNTFKQESINEKVKIADYSDMVKRFVKYCETSKKAPAYVMTGKRKVGFALFAYCLAKIVNYYQINKAMPNYCIMNSKDLSNAGSSAQNNASNSASGNKKPSTSTSNCQNPYTSAPHLTTTASGLGQDYPWDCSCNALQQCLYKLSGKKISEATLIKVTGCGVNGVGHDGINTAIAWFNKTYKTKYTIEWRYFSDLAESRDKRFEVLARLICKPNIAVLTHIGYANSGKSPITKNSKIFGHYEVLDKVNTKTKYVRALNSLGNKLNANAYAGHLQERTYETQASFFAHTSGGQKAIAIIKRG